MKMILGKKIGMTQIFADTGEVIPVTVIQAGPEVVTQVKTVETDGYNAVQVGYEDTLEKRVNKPLRGHLAKSGVLKKHLAEFAVCDGETYEVGQEITVADFEVGRKLDVTGTSKGKADSSGVLFFFFGRKKGSLLKILYLAGPIVKTSSTSVVSSSGAN